MKHILITLGLIAVMSSGAAAQSTTNVSFVGVWKGELSGGVPSLGVVLADDGGTLGGTIVLYQVKMRFPGDTPQFLAQEPHLMIEPQIHGNSLTFRIQTSKGRSSRSA